MTIHLPPDGVLRAITIHEPDASLAAMGFKTIENRGFSVPSDWPLPITFAIHASKSDIRLTHDGHWDSLLWHKGIAEAFSNPQCTGEIGSYYFYGSTIIGLVDVVACVDMPEFGNLKGDALEAAIDEHFKQWPIESGPDRELARGNWAQGPKCWVLANARRFEQGYATRGYQRFWQVPPDIQASIIGGRKIILGPQDMPQPPEDHGAGVEVVGKPKVLKETIS